MEGEENKKSDNYALAMRVSKLEEIVEEIRNELKQKSVSDAQMQKILEVIANNQNILSGDVKELRMEMVKLVAETLNKTREDMTTFMRMQEKNEEKEREHKRALEQMERQHHTRSEDKDKAFYQRVIVACISVGGTIVLTFFGIKSLISIFGK